MFQMKVVTSGSGESHNFGPPVDTLEECTTFVKALDWMFKQREELYVDTLPWPSWFPAIDSYEGCDIYAESEDGRMWVLGDGDVWELEDFTYLQDMR
jgi:hypothetical protein